GLDKDLNAALTLAARNAIKFVATPGEDQRARRLRAVQRRGELPRDPGGGHRARRPRADTEEHLRPPAQARDDDGMSGSPAAATSAVGLGCVKTLGGDRSGGAR